jgi:hypothetical protein
MQLVDFYEQGVEATETLEFEDSRDVQDVPRPVAAEAGARTRRPRTLSCPAAMVGAAVRKERMLDCRCKKNKSWLGHHLTK